MTNTIATKRLLIAASLALALALVGSIGLSDQAFAQDQECEGKKDGDAHNCGGGGSPGPDGPIGGGGATGGDGGGGGYIETDPIPIVDPPAPKPPVSTPPPAPKPPVSTPPPLNLPPGTPPPVHEPPEPKDNNKPPGPITPAPVNHTPIDQLPVHLPPPDTGPPDNQPPTNPKPPDNVGDGKGGKHNADKGHKGRRPSPRSDYDAGSPRTPGTGGSSIWNADDNLTLGELGLDKMSENKMSEREQMEFFNKNAPFGHVNSDGAALYEDNIAYRENMEANFMMLRAFLGLLPSTYGGVGISKLAAGIKPVGHTKVSTPVAPKPPWSGPGGKHPAVPAGMKVSEFGKKMWGTGPKDAMKSLSELTPEKLKALGVTREMAREWAAFYWTAPLRGEGGATAVYRERLMREAAELLTP